MGFFSKAAKPNPRIVVQGIEIEFHRENEWWGFIYQETEFLSFEFSLVLPSKEELDAILESLEALKPEMAARLKKGLSEWGDAKQNDGESYSVDLSGYGIDQTFIVCWSDGASWGDLGVDFTIKDNAIMDESWGD